MSRNLLASLKQTYLTVDPRSLGLFRIALGCVLLFDLGRRFVQLDYWYTNDGLLPNHTLLWRPPAGHVFSLFFTASHQAEAVVGFGLCAIVYVLFTLGYRTGLMHALALICRVSLNSRLAVLENGGDMVLNLLCVFSLALPLGRRFSLDAWRRSLHAPGNAPHTPDAQPVVSLAVLGLLLQFAVIYFFNAISKSGDTWTGGTAVHYALHQDRIVTSLGVWMREHLPLELIRGLTWSTLAIEWSAFALLVTPVLVGPARLIAFCMLPLLHLSFALGLQLGAFSYAMMAFFPMLLRREHWEALTRWWMRHDLPQRLASWLQRPAMAGALARGQRLALAGYGPMRMVAIDSAPVDSAPVDMVPAGKARGGARTSTIPEPQPLRHPRTWWLKEAVVAVLILAIGIEILNDNTSVPRWMRVPRQPWSIAVIEYPRLLQGWRMFAPNPSRVDSMIFIDAVTSEGRHVDPFNEVAGRYPFPSGDVVPERMGYGQFFSMYADRISMPRYAAYRHAFKEWLLAYPKRTGRSADCLVAFDVYLVVDESPAPGSRAQPTPSRREKFMEHRAAPGDPCKPTRPFR